MRMNHLARKKRMAATIDEANVGTKHLNPIRSPCMNVLRTIKALRITSSSISITLTGTQSVMTVVKCRIQISQIQRKFSDYINNSKIPQVDDSSVVLYFDRSLSQAQSKARKQFLLGLAMLLRFISVRDQGQEEWPLSFLCQPFQLFDAPQ